jgi:hypothetical protein
LETSDLAGKSESLYDVWIPHPVTVSCLSLLLSRLEYVGIPEIKIMLFLVIIKDTWGSENNV